MVNTTRSKRSKHKLNVPPPLYIENYNHHHPVHIAPPSPLRQDVRPHSPYSSPSTQTRYKPAACPSSPPTVTPYVMSTHQTRHEKSLYGANCCFCEESLEYTLAGEKVVVLECGHTCHHECLFELIDTSIPLVLENFDKVMPRCSTCGEAGIPLDNSLHLDLLKKKLLSLPCTPMESHGVHLPGSYIKSPLGYSQTAPWSPKSQHASPRNHRHKLSTISAISFSSMGSERSHYSHSSISSVDSGDYKVDLNTRPSTIQEVSLAIPNRILQSRIRKVVAPSVEIIPEVDTVVAKSAYISGSKAPKDLYVTTAVSVQILSDNVHQQLSPTTSSSSARMQDSSIRTRLTNYIHDSIPDWKSLDFSKFGTIRLCDKFYISQDQQHWQKLDCYLFEHILIFVRRYSDSRTPQLKGSVAIKDHLTSLSLPPTGSRTSHHLTLNLSTDNLPTIHLKTSDHIALENWYAALMDWNSFFPPPRLVPSDDMTGQSLAESEGSPLVRQPTSSHMPTDTVILVPLSGSPNGSKFPAIRNTILSIMREMTLFDRISIVPYGNGVNQYIYGLAYNTWKPWLKVIDSLKPTGGAGSRSDLMNGIATALNVLRARTTQNPVSSILIISDSLSDFPEGSFETIGSRAAVQNIKVHTFGVSNHHSADKLESISSKCNGNYFYLRKWDELHQTIVGQFRSLQSYTHCNISISLDTTPGVSIVGIAGHNPKVALNHTEKLPKASPLSPTSYTTEVLNSLIHLVELGDMTESEQRTFLVQVRISGDALPLGKSGKYINTPFELFTASLAFSSFGGPAEGCLHRDEYFIPLDGVSVAVESLNAFIQDLIHSPQALMHRDSWNITGGESMHGQDSSGSSSSVYVSSSSSLPPSPAEAFVTVVQQGLQQHKQQQEYAEDVSPNPSIVYGDLIAAGQESALLAPMYLSLEKYDIRVVQRRIQLTAINILEFVVRVDLRNKKTEQVVKSIDSARAIINGLLACANANTHGKHGSSRLKVQGVEEPDDALMKKRGPSQNGKLSAISVEVHKLVEILDDMLATTAEQIKEVTAFEEDYRKLLIQNIGILRNEKGYTRRTPLEILFLQRQQVNNVI